MLPGKRRGLAVFVLLCCSRLVLAQDATGRIEGRVLKAGRGLAGVAVVLSPPQLVAISDETGTFVFDAVSPGTYTLVLTFGEETALQENVGVVAGQTRQVDVEVDWEDRVQETVKVTAAAARAAKIVDAPAAVTAVHEEEIAADAATGQVPKVLEFTAGAEITQSGLYDFNFNTRGFNSSLNRRVSTYIDGRDVGVVLLGAQEWAAVSGGLDDMGALEFIRGPSAALYGANASSGVVNITTKAPRDSQGTLLRFTGGELETRNVNFRQAGEIGGGWYYKVLASYQASGDFTVSRNPDGDDRLPSTGDDLDAPEYSTFCLLVGESDCLLEEKSLFREQDNNIKSGLLRVDKYLGDESVLTLEAGASAIEGPVFLTGIGRVQAIEADRPFFRVAYGAERWNILAHYTKREGDQANLTKDLLTNYQLLTDDVRYGVEAQANWSFMGDRGRFVIGGAHTEEEVDTINHDTGRQTVLWEPVETDRQAIFSQFDWKASDHFKVVLAGRVDWNTLHDTQLSPKVALVYSLNPKHSTRLTFNKAFQVANYSEFFLHTRIASFPIGGFVRTICEGPLADAIAGGPVDCGIDEDFVPILAVGNDDLQLEQTSAWEVGYSGLFANRAFLTVDYYNSENDDFITDLVPQVGTSLGSVPCTDDQFGVPTSDPSRCPINPDYLRWISTDEAENTYICQDCIAGPDGNVYDLSFAQALRNAVNNSVGGSTLGFRLAQDLDGATVVVGRTYTNVGAVDTQGVDVSLQVFLSEAWNVQANYSWFDFEILDKNEDAAEVLLPNSPEHKASVSLSYRSPRFMVSLSSRWVHGFPWSAGVFQGFVPDYATEDLAVMYRFSKVVSLSVNVANLRDNVHYEAYGGDLISRRAIANLSFEW